MQTLKIVVWAVVLGMAACASHGPRGGGGPVSGGAAELHGTVSYRQRIVMPPGAVVSVKLVDVCREGTAPVVLGEQTITHPGQVPVPFVVKYERTKIRAGCRYEVQARIEVDGRLRWINTAATPVLSAGAPMDNVEVWLDQVSDR